MLDSDIKHKDVKELVHISQRLPLESKAKAEIMPGLIKVLNNCHEQNRNFEEFMTTVQKKELLAAVMVCERDKYLAWLTENQDMDPEAVSKLIAYLSKSEAIYKQAERDVTQAHNEGMTDPNRVAAQSEKRIVHK